MLMAHVASILKRVVISREGSFKLEGLFGFRHLSLVDMLHAIGGSFNIYGSLASMCHTSFGLFACLDFGTCNLFLFSPLLECFLSMRFARVSSLELLI